MEKLTEAECMKIRKMNEEIAKRVNEDLDSAFAYADAHAKPEMKKVPGSMYDYFRAVERLYMADKEDEAAKLYAEITEDDYNDQMGQVPPLRMGSYWFIGGEQVSMGYYHLFIKLGGKYYTALCKPNAVQPVRDAIAHSESMAKGRDGATNESFVDAGSPDNMEKLKKLKPIVVRVTTDKGTSWTTRINGDLDSAKEYFMGNWFNTGTYPQEKMERAVKVELVEKPDESVVNEMKIELSADGKYLSTTTRYKTVKDAIASLKDKKDVEVAGKGKVDIDGKKITGKILKESTAYAQFSKLLNDTRKDYSKDGEDVVAVNGAFGNLAERFRNEDVYGVLATLRDLNIKAPASLAMYLAIVRDLDQRNVRAGFETQKHLDQFMVNIEKFFAKVYSEYKLKMQMARDGAKFDEIFPGAGDVKGEAPVVADRKMLDDVFAKWKATGNANESITESSIPVVDEVMNHLHDDHNLGIARDALETKYSVEEADAIMRDPFSAENTEIIRAALEEFLVEDEPVAESKVWKLAQTSLRESDIMRFV